MVMYTDIGLIEQIARKWDETEESIVPIKKDRTN